MRALVYSRPRGPVTLTEVPAPTAPPAGAVVQVAATGLCRSDWHGWMGHDPDIRRFPHVPGHEFAGTVVEVGSGVDTAWIGRRVTAPFVYACGACEVCSAGDGQVCPAQQQPGFSLPGSFAEYVTVAAAAENLVAIPDDLSFRAAAGLGCRVATAYRGIVGRAKVETGEWVAVFGAGGVGLSAVAIAVSRGARVVVVDPSERARELAAALGAEVTLTDASDIVDVTEGGAHVSMDAFGSAQTCRDSILALRRRGRQVQVGLLGNESPEVPMGRVIGWELDLLGSHGMPAHDYAALLDDVVAGRVAIERLLANGPDLTLEEAADALPGLPGIVGRPGIRVIDPGLLR